MAEEIADEKTALRAPSDPGAAYAALAAASRDKADAFLAEQTEVLRLTKERMQREDASLEEEQRLQLSHLRLRRFGDYMRTALEIAVGLVILLVVAGIGAMVWYATQDRDLVVEAFSVPPDMAQTGMTGSALAGRVLDRFGAMDADTHSFTEDLSSYHANTSDELRVEIPNTGISIGELNRYLRAWLGHEMHVTGELVRTPKGLRLAVRYAGRPASVAQGPADDLEVLAQKAAENLFRAAHPLRFADYLAAHNRVAEARAIAEAETQKGDDRHRAVAYVSLGVADYWDGDSQALGRDGAAAVRLDPTNLAALFIVQAAANNLGHDEEVRRASMAAMPLAEAQASTAASAELVHGLPQEFDASIKEVEGDAQGAIEVCKTVVGRGAGACSAGSLVGTYASVYDVQAARALAGEIPTSLPNGKPDIDLMVAWTQIELVAGDYAGAVAWARKAEALSAKDPTTFLDRDVFLRPYEVEAMARSGDIAGAAALAATMSQDCDLCLRGRGRVAMLAGDWTGAAHWFSLVAARSPHIPFADSDRGMMLLRKGDLDGATAKFESAHAKGPHFADPLEMWGEALVLKNRADLALAKFEEAAKYAPNWGRLHLKWGEALWWSGKRDEARKQFDIASKLDLAPSEKLEVTRMKVGHGG